MSEPRTLFVTTKQLAVMLDGSDALLVTAQPALHMAVSSVGVVVYLAFLGSLNRYVLASTRQPGESLIFKTADAAIKACARIWLASGLATQPMVLVQLPELELEGEE